MRVLTTLGFVAAIIIGIACIKVDTWSNVEFLVGRPLAPADIFESDVWNSLTAAVVVVAIATAAALTTAGIAWRRRCYILAIGLVVAFLCGAAFSLSATIDRVASTKDGSVHKARSHNHAIGAADRAVAKHTRELSEAQAGMKRECAGRDPAELSDSGWPNCRRDWRKAETAKAALELAVARRDRLGATVTEDSGADRIAALLPGVSPDQVTRFQPLLLPFALFLFGNFLTAYGFTGMTPIRIVEANPEPVIVRPMRDITPDPVVAALESAGRPLNNTEVARIAGVSPATAHRRVNELTREGRVSKERVGRGVAIALVK